MSYIDKYYEVKDELIGYKSINKLLREYLLKSNIAIEECMKIMNYLNFVEDGTCINDSYFLSKNLTNQELKRVLETI